MSGQCQGVSLAWHGWARLRKPLNVNTLETGGGPHTLMGTHSPAHTHTHICGHTDLENSGKKRSGGSVLPSSSGRVRGKMADDETSLAAFIRSHLNVTH